MQSTTSTTTMTPAAKSKKLEEAREYSEKGMKYLKTTIFQWAPDHLAAAPQFDKSADAYKAAGELTNARLMYVKAAESHYGSGTFTRHTKTQSHSKQIISSIELRIGATFHTSTNYVEILIHTNTNTSIYINTYIRIFRGLVRVIHTHTYIQYINK